MSMRSSPKSLPNSCKPFSWTNLLRFSGEQMTGTEHYVSRADGRVYYYKVGEGEPLILLHNIELSGFTWENVIDKLAEHFTCYNIDLPGHDHSDIPPQQYSIEDYTQAFVDVLDDAGLAQVDIVASHGGCVMALDLAATYPQRVKRMILDGLPYWNRERGRIVWERFWVPRFKDTTSYDVPVYALTTWEEAVQENPNLIRERWEKTEALKRKGRYWMRLTAEAMCSYDIEATGPKVKAPTLLLYGEGDPLRRGEQRANEGIKGSTLKVVPGPQVPPHEHRLVEVHIREPEEFARMAIEFLREPDDLPELQ